MNAALGTWNQLMSGRVGSVAVVPVSLMLIVSVPVVPIISMSVGVMIFRFIFRKLSQVSAGSRKLHRATQKHDGQ